MGRKESNQTKQNKKNSNLVKLHFFYNKKSVLNNLNSSIHYIGIFVSIQPCSGNPDALKQYFQE